MMSRPYRCALCWLPVFDRPMWLDPGQVSRLEAASGRSGLWDWASFWDNISRTGKTPVHHDCTLRWNWTRWSGVPDREPRSPEV